MAESYGEWLRENLSDMIDMLNLSDLQKHYLRARWLDQVIWMEARATASRDRYYLLRRTTIIGGAIVPALVGLNAFQGLFGDLIYWFIFFISLLVAIAAALEEFHHYSDRWRHYRSIVEELKITGWQFFQLSGQFSSFESHKLAYVTFVNTVEDIMQREVQIYVNRISKEQTNQEEETARRRAQAQQAQSAAAQSQAPPTASLSRTTQPSLPPIEDEQLPLLN